MKVAQNKKRRKLYDMNIANIEALLRNLNLRENHLFLRWDLPIPTKYALLLCEASLAIAGPPLSLKHILCCFFPRRQYPYGSEKKSAPPSEAASNSFDSSAL